MKTNSLTLTVYLIVNLCLISNAQEVSLVWKSNNFFSEKEQKTIELKQDKIFSQFYVVLNKGNFSMIEYSSDQKGWKKLTRNPHNHDMVISDLVFVPDNTHTIHFRLKGELDFYAGFQYLSPFITHDKIITLRSDECDLPPVVPQSVWRAGLPDPVPGRVASKTNHLIIHHSAGQTISDNYTDVVRAYYLYHINGNGWDDIGYNYLIDPNGVIYAGRDPENSEATQDNVVGAHLCGKNTGTMGVCVIGDYTDIFPSDTAVNQLINLLAWKIIKDTLEIYGEANHPFPDGALLPKIAGHRDGCSTTCPGASFYPAIESDIKNRINEKVQSCLTGTSLLPGFMDAEIKISPNPFKNFINIESDHINGEYSYNIYNTEGKIVKKANMISNKRIELSDLNTGVYFIEIISATYSRTLKLIKN